MEAVTSPTLWSTVAALPDYLLLLQTRQLARHEQALQILVLDHLREIEARRLHLTRGYGSLFDYVVHELGYTAAAAWRRIKAMRLCTQTDAARELLRDGSLNLSNAAQLQNVFERSDRSDRSRGRPPVSAGVGGGVGGEPRNDGQRGVQGPGEPAPAAPKGAGGREAEPAAGPVLDAAAREELVRQAAGKSTREVQQMLAEVDPELARSSDRVRALGGGRWELKATVDAECRHGLEKLQMLLSHRDPHLTLGGLVARLVRDGLDRYDPARSPSARRTGGRGSVNGERTASQPARGDAAAKRGTGAECGGAEAARVRDGAGQVTSEMKRHTRADSGRANSAAVRGIARRSDSAAKRDTEAERGSAKSAAVRDGGARTDSAAMRSSEARHGGTSLAAVSASGAHTASPAKRNSGAERGSATPAAVPASGARTDPAAKRPSESEHRSVSPAAVPNSGWHTTSAAKRQRRADGDGRDGGGGGVLDSATWAGGPRFEADRGNAAWVPVPGNRGFPTSAAKRLAYAAGHGVVGPAERSPGLERHLAALRCVGAVPGSRSRYIPAAVRREVWRRDEGCCSYVDRYSGRRCGSRYRLEIDHIVPFALGGGAEPADLRLLCESHHRLRHAQRHAHAESVPNDGGHAPAFAVDPKERGRTVGSHAPIDPAGA